MLSAGLNTQKNRFRFRPGLRPGLHWVSLHRSPNLVGGQGAPAPVPMNLTLWPRSSATPPLLITFRRPCLGIKPVEERR